MRQRSFPDLADLDIRVARFRSRADYFRSRFTLRDYFFSSRMKYVIDVNPEAWTLRAPESGIEAVVAHELSHVVYYQSGARIRLIGLIRLLSVRFMAKFERDTDAAAIARGYGPGLIDYRRWLYAHVTPAVAARKKKIYMTPEQIQALLDRRLPPKNQH